MGKKEKTAVEGGKKSKKKFITRVVALSVTGAFVVSVGIWAAVAFTKKQKRNDISYGYGSVMYEVEKGETYSTDKDYTGLDIFGRLNWTFARKSNWYSEYHGNVQTAAGPQDVQTYKQYNNGILISSDITTSSMVNLARQFCYSEEYNRVVWREDSTKNKGSWDGINTVFPDDVEPEGNMDITGDDEESFKTSFTALNGLPATELSVYVFREETISSVDPIKANGDGTFTVVYHMNPDPTTDETGFVGGATAYYGNQMVFTGGIDAPPSFKYITIGYTFNANWETLRCTVEESYSASMKTIKTSCTSQASTVYEYNTEKAYSTAYEDYFKQWVESAATGQKDRALTALDCLMGAFGKVLAEPVLLNADVRLNNRSQGGAVYVDLGMNGGDFNDLGSLLDLSKLDVRADFGGVKIWLDSGTVYLAIGDLKVSASITDILAATPATASETSTTGSSGTPAFLTSLIEAPVVQDREAGTAYLRWDLSLGDIDLPIEFYFNVNGKNVSLDHVSLSLGVLDVTLGADIKYGNVADKPALLSAAEKEEYLSVTDYVMPLVDLFSSGYIKAEISYTYGTYDELKVVGSITLDINDFNNITASGSVRLTYGSIDRTVQIAYLGGKVYLALEGMKLRASASDAIEIVQDLLTKEEEQAISLAEERYGFSLAAILDKIFDYGIGNLVTVPGDSSALALVIKGTELIRLFGLDFALGDVNVSVDGDGIHASALGVNLEIGKGKSFTVDTTDYVEVNDLIKKLPEILGDQAISLTGSLNVTVGSTVVTVTLNEGSMISWRNNKILFFVDMTLSVNGSEHGLFFEVTSDEDGDVLIRFMYSDICAELRVSEIGQLKDAIKALSDRVKGILAKILDDGKTESTPSPESLEGLMKLLSAGTAIATVAEEIGPDLSWTSIFDNFKFEKSEAGLVKLTIGDFWAELAKQTDDNGLLQFSIGYAGDGFSIGGTLKAATESSETLPSMPEAMTTLTATEYVYLLDYVGAMIDLLTEQNLNVSFEATVTSTEEAYADYQGVKSKIKGDLHFYQGATFPLHLSLEEGNKELTVNTDLYLQFSLSMTNNAGEAPLYLDIMVVDANPKGETGDGMLDFYVSVSSFGPDAEGYAPLRLYAPAGELMTILSGALVLFGMDMDILNDFLITKWIADLETTEQLRALGDSLKEFIGDFGIDLEGMLAQLGGFIGSGAGAQAYNMAPVDVEVRKEFIKKIVVGDKHFELALNGNAIYGEKVENDIVFTLDLTADENGYTSLAVSLDGVWNNEATEETKVTIDINTDEIEAESRIRPIDADKYIDFTGISDLILTLARSTTHAETTDDVISGDPNVQDATGYQLNRYFYIYGSINVALSFGFIDAVDLKIDIIALSVTIDQNGDLAVNVRLDYQGNYSGIAAAGGFLAGLAGYDIDGYIVKGDSTVDVTIKNNMVYMKRVQTSSIGALGRETDLSANPIILYRAATLDTFLGNIFEHLQFLFNLGDKIWKIIYDMGGLGEDKSEEPEEEKTPIDFGSYIKGYSYTQRIQNEETGEITTPAKWDITVNGDALAKGVVGDLQVVFSEDTDGFIHDLYVKTSIVSIITAELNLRWANPGGIMEKDGEGNEVKDVTTDKIVEEITDKEHGMGAMIEYLDTSNGWWNKTENPEGQKFLEGQTLDVKYVYDPVRGGSEQIFDTQKVMVSTGADGNTAYTLYSEAINAIDVSLRNNAEYRYTPNGDWITYGCGDVVPQNLKYSIREEIMTYKVRFECESALDSDWLFDEIENVYYVERDMLYGAVINALGEETVVQGEGIVITLPRTPQSDDGRTGSWKTPEIAADGAVFDATYPAEITYTSKIAFTTLEGVDGIAGEYTHSATFNSTNYELLIPTAEGYEFLGWFEKVGDTWAQRETLNAAEVASVTVEALWMSNLTVTIDSATRVYRTESTTGSLSKTTTYYYDYETTISIKGGVLVGAFAEDVTEITTTYKYEVYRSNSSSLVGEVTDNSYLATAQISNTNVESGTKTKPLIGGTTVATKNDGRATVTISYSYGEIFTTEFTQTATNPFEAIS